jgi:hypothetical protein
VVGRASAVLATRRGAAFVVVAAAVVTWFVVAPHLARLSLWPAILLVSLAIIPGTLLLVLVTLPVCRERWLFPGAVALALIAFGCSEAGLDLEANFAKLAAAVFAGWAFLALFEQLSWVVLVALIIPFVDILSVWRGPTHSITQHHFAVYTAVAIAFLVPGGGAAYLGPPDVLFFALFLAAAYRWNLRVGWTWLATSGMYAVTVIVATAASVGGLPALPFLSFGFLAANADLLWRRLRRPPSAKPA